MRGKPRAIKRLYDWPGRVTCVSVIDGDTIRAVFDQGFDTEHKERRLRLAGIDSREMRGGTAATREQAQAAKARMEELLPPGTVFSARTEPDPEKYGGYLGFIVLADGTNVNALMLAESLAQPYAGGARASAEPPS